MAATFAVIVVNPIVFSSSCVAGLKHNGLWTEGGVRSGKIFWAFSVLRNENSQGCKFSGMRMAHYQSCECSTWNNGGGGYYVVTFFRKKFVFPVDKKPEL